jgi:uncharacterized protein (TIGR03000 family)
MVSNLRRVFLVVLFSAIAGAASFAWADHGHGGGGGGHGHSGGGSHSGGHGFSGGSSHVSHGDFGGHGGSSNHWGGSSARYYSGYHNHGSPYNYYRHNYYRPYAYGFGFPFLYGLYGYGGYPGSYYGYPSYYDSYPSDYDVNGDDDFYANAPLPREYVVNRPVSDVAQVQFRLPDPQATIWVEGQEITSSGTVRQFKSPQLDPSQQYTYTVKAEWNDNGKPVTDERRVKVQANALAVVDFTRPSQAASNGRRAPLPDLPPPQPRPAD